LRGRHLLTRGLQHPCEVPAHVVLVGDEARGGIGDTPRDADVPYALAAAPANPVDDVLRLARLGFARLLLGLVLELAEVESASRSGCERLSAEPRGLARAT